MNDNTTIKKEIPLKDLGFKKIRENIPLYKIQEGETYCKRELILKGKIEYLADILSGTMNTPLKASLPNQPPLELIHVVNTYNYKIILSSTESNYHIQVVGNNVKALVQELNQLCLIPHGKQEKVEEYIEAIIQLTRFENRSYYYE